MDPRVRGHAGFSLTPGLDISGRRASGCGVRFVVGDSVAASGWKVHARLRVAADAERVLDRINPSVGMVESISANECLLITGADSLDTIAAYIGMLGMDFTVESPDELRPLLRTYATRYLRAAGDS